MGFFSQREEIRNSVFSATGLANPDTGKLNTDLTGRFLVTHYRETQYMLILYVYDTNEILVESIKKKVIQTCCMRMISYTTHEKMWDMHHN